MSKKTFMLLWVILLCVLLCGCGKQEAEAPAVTAQPTPTATPEPTPVPTPAPTTWTITDESADQILTLAEIPSLVHIDATKSQEYDALLQLHKLLPNCDIRWSYTFQGKSYSSSTRELKVTDLTGLEDAIRYLPKLETIDLTETDAVLEDLDRFDAVRPGIFYLWNFRFNGFKMNTDIRVFSTLRDGTGRRFTDKELYPIVKYCRHLKALDLGHNQLSDLSSIGELKELEVLILSGNPIEDASPLGNLKNLSYLELFMCPNIRDFSFLSQLTKLQDLNLCYDFGCTNLSFLGSMPGLRFGSFKLTGVTPEDFKTWQEKMPESVLVYWDGNLDSSASGWHDTARSIQVRRAFNGWRHISEYRGIGDLDLVPGKYFY